ncbi:hypothetical protein HJG60_011450 [Phyllostomus discolor]|uniref:Uncharacterized protein n=1 Tax=Phyllostomus discolor TaxID=89673 RepID=A0A834A4C4_9CHIR|nr:hypothetical protein HJG60_011450 [Phyllostomus discolor]
MGTCPQFTRRHSSCPHISPLRSAPCGHRNPSTCPRPLHGPVVSAAHSGSKPWPAPGHHRGWLCPLVAGAHQEWGFCARCVLGSLLSPCSFCLGAWGLAPFCLVSLSHCVGGGLATQPEWGVLWAVPSSLSPVHARLGPGGGRGLLTLVPKASLCQVARPVS